MEDSSSNFSTVLDKSKNYSIEEVSEVGSEFISENKNYSMEKMGERKVNK